MDSNDAITIHSEGKPNCIFAVIDKFFGRMIIIFAIMNVIFAIMNVISGIMNVIFAIMNVIFGIMNAIFGIMNVIFAITFKYDGQSLFIAGYIFSF